MWRGKESLELDADSFKRGEREREREKIIGTKIKQSVRHEIISNILRLKGFEKPVNEFFMRNRIFAKGSISRCIISSVLTS